MEIDIQDTIGLVEGLYQILWKKPDRRDAPTNGAGGGGPGGMEAGFAPPPRSFCFRLPDTIIYKRNRPFWWYFTSRRSADEEYGGMNVVKKKRPCHLNDRSILQAICSSEGSISDTVAVWYYSSNQPAPSEARCHSPTSSSAMSPNRHRSKSMASFASETAPGQRHKSIFAPQFGGSSESGSAGKREPSVSAMLLSHDSDRGMTAGGGAGAGTSRKDQHQHVRCRYFDRQSLTDFLVYSHDKEDGALQVFMDPKACPDGVIRNCTIQSTWQGGCNAETQVCMLEKRQNNYLSNNTRVDLHARLATFETNRHSQMVPVSSSIVHRIIRQASEEVVSQFNAVSPDKNISRIVLHWKFDANDVLWLLYCSEIRVVPKPMYQRVTATMVLDPINNPETVCASLRTMLRRHKTTVNLGALWSEIRAINQEELLASARTPTHKVVQLPVFPLHFSPTPLMPQALMELQQSPEKLAFGSPFPKDSAHPILELSAVKGSPGLVPSFALQPGKTPRTGHPKLRVVVSVAGQAAGELKAGEISQGPSTHPTPLPTTPITSPNRTPRAPRGETPSFIARCDAERNVQSQSEEAIATYRSPRLTTPQATARGSPPRSPPRTASPGPIRGVENPSSRSPARSKTSGGSQTPPKSITPLLLPEAKFGDLECKIPMLDIGDNTDAQTGQPTQGDPKFSPPDTTTLSSETTPEMSAAPPPPATPPPTEPQAPPTDTEATATIPLSPVTPPPSMGRFVKLHHAWANRNLEIALEEKRAKQESKLLSSYRHTVKELSSLRRKREKSAANPEADEARVFDELILQADAKARARQQKLKKAVNGQWSHLYFRPTITQVIRDRRQTVDSSAVINASSLGRGGARAKSTGGLGEKWH